MALAIAGGALVRGLMLWGKSLGGLAKIGTSLLKFGACAGKRKA